MIIAKPVIDKQFWILRQDNEKVGNVEACAGGFQLKINDRVEKFKTIRMLQQRAGIQFEHALNNHVKSVQNLVHGYPASGKVHNPIWDVRHKLPLFTKTKKSKSWFAAGWYCVTRGKNSKIVQDPKLITLQRYKYTGPFYSKEEAQ